MTSEITVTLAVEGTADESVMRRVLRDHDIAVAQVLGLRGKQYLDQKLHAFNAAARFSEWLVVRDLDHDADCAPDFVRDRLPRASPGMHLRIAVRALEAWLLADVQGVASYFSVGRHHIPTDVERLPDPKRALIDVAGRSRKRAVREDMVPDRQTTARVGPGFIARILEFADSDWSWERAAKQSESLRRCLARLRKTKAR
jgi:hypothetical protein